MRYQYSSYNYNKMGNNISNGVRTLLIINITIFMITNLLGMRYEFFSKFGLVPYQFFQELNLWQPITYMFLHGNLIHILFNMLVLWMFGNELERILGKSKFLELYFFCGIGSGIITLLFNYNSYTPVVGASGAIYGLFAAYAIIYPNRNVYFYFLFPIKIKYLLFLISSISFLSIILQQNTSISHITHLGGIIFCLIYFNINKISNYKKIFTSLYKTKDGNKIVSINKKKMNRELEINNILDKINLSGIESLSQNELNKLKDSSEIHSDENRPN